MERYCQRPSDTVLALIPNTSIENASDHYRFQSIKNGVTIFSENPFLGVGIGDLKSAMEEMPDSRFQKGLILPHNQFVFVATFSGLIGLVWFGYIYNCKSNSPIFFSAGVFSDCRVFVFV